MVFVGVSVAVDNAFDNQGASVANACSLNVEMAVVAGCVADAEVGTERVVVSHTAEVVVLYALHLSW